MFTARNTKTHLFAVRLKYRLVNSDIPKCRVSECSLCGGLLAFVESFLNSLPREVIETQQL